MHDAFDLPEMPPTETVHELWQEAGISGRSFDGSPLPLSWSEIDAYRRMTESPRPAIVWQTIRAMSEAYVTGLNDTRPLSIAPMDRVDEEHELD